MNCKGVFQVLQRVILKSMARVVRALIIGTIAAGTLWVAMPHFAMAGPDTVDVDENVATATGDQSDGVASGVDFDTPPVNTLNVNSLSGDIQPAPSSPGILFHNNSGGNVTVNSGIPQDNVVISTEGINASGIVAISEGAPSGVVWLPGLGVLAPSGPAGSGGPVQVTSYSDITTSGDNAYGIYAQNKIGVYNPLSISSMSSFSMDAIEFSLTSVAGAPDNIGVEVEGDNGGIFTLNIDGTFEFDPAGLTDTLEPGESLVTKLDYQVVIRNTTPGYYIDPSFPYGSQSSEGSIALRVTKNEDGSLDVIPEIYFEEFDSYNYMADGQPPSLWPNLQYYVDALSADMGIAGSGDSIIVINNGTITTGGVSSHGIFAETAGGQGSHGRNGSFWDAGRIPTEGGPGSNGGAMAVINNGGIETDGDASAGILAVSTGGKGGHGGDGSDWRYGKKGGTGGTGGEITVTGSGKIQTTGDYSSGILAVSQGGVGGEGGEGAGTTGGGSGGFGGKGGTVNVMGNWTISTDGNKAHAIWAKSVGGSAGAGGSGGWLFGSPGSGGSGSDGGRVEVASGGLLTTRGDDSYGIYAESVGGFGGSGGISTGFLWSFGGDGGSGGSGGEVEINNLENGVIRTEGQRAHAVFAQSIGGGGGSGGGEFGLFASLGGEGNAGGHGGTVQITNEGLIQTFGYRSRGIYAQSIGGGGGDGAGSTGLVAIGGAGSGTSNGGAVSVINSGTIATAGEKSHAIFAESIGGGGGDGGDSGGLVSIGGAGGDGGNGGTVQVFNSGRLTTDQNESSAIFAQSIGGGGGNGGDSVSIGGLASVSIGGQGGDGGYSSKVDIINSSDGNIITAGDRSYGIYAQSVGGGGGNGGFAVSVGIPVSIVSLAIGGQAGGGGDGNEVEVHNEGVITTLGNESHGIIAQSVGGGGGTGGFAVSGNLGGSVSLQLALGGKGGSGGMGKAVNVGTELNPIEGTINTSGQRSYGILAQSIGGGGGDGGFSIAGSGVTGTSLNLAIGGKGGGGGKGGVVNVNSNSNISTKGDDAHAIVAQSIGGGGGNGGFSLAASYGGGTGLNFGFGGSGGTGNAGGAVSVGTELNPLGGNITTSGDRAYGVMAQSVGGGGGSGGSSITGQLLGGQTIAFSFGGDGGMGGLGGMVDIDSASNIFTQGEQSHGIFAQSVGGGGGNGGLSIGAAVTAFGGLNFSMGGDGGNGNSGGTVEVNNSGIIETINEYSHGIMAQSIGGGGGAGGTSGSVMVNFSSLIPIPPEIPIKGSVNIAASIGGDGGEGGEGGIVKVTNSGTIITHEDSSYGIFAQSVGGGGGDGGKSIAATANISLPEDPSGGGGGGGSSQPQMEVQLDFALTIGGDGGNGNSGGSVDVINSGAIDTFGDSSHGIFAQSVGGGGGKGGDARSMTLSIDPSNSALFPSEPPPSLTSIQKAVNISVGGSGGSGGDGDSVTVTNRANISTRDADSYGIFAQSVGGGGGTGGGGYHGLDWTELGVPEDLAPIVEEMMPIESQGDIVVIVGGSGGASGDGGRVEVKNEDGSNIVTLGDGSVGIFAHSIGGGGGIGGVGAVGEEGTVGIGGRGGAAGNGGDVEVTNSGNGNIDTFGKGAHGIFAQSVGGGGGVAGNVDRGIDSFGIDSLFNPDFNLNFMDKLPDGFIDEFSDFNWDFDANGGCAGNGGNVTVTNTGNITTRGDGAYGIFAQSVGGGGGVAGRSQETVVEEGGNAITKWIASRFGFAGSVGGDGAGGEVDVFLNGDITTYGYAAHGIFAQSAGGKSGTDGMTVYNGVGGAVSVEINGNILVEGADADGIIAQSIGLDGAGNVRVEIAEGMVRGGSEAGAGIRFLDGAANLLENHGSVSALSDLAVMAGGGNETIDNYGIITGLVDLGAGSNAFNNMVGGTFNTGATVNLDGGTLSNAGMFSPGGSGIVLTAGLNGNLTQAGSGTYAVDLDFDSGMGDLLNVSGTADLAGKAYINILNPGWSTPGTQQITVLSGAGGVIDLGLSLDFQPSAVITYDLLYPNATDVMLRTSVDFNPPSAGLNANQTAIANAVNKIQLAGGSASFAPFAAALCRMPNMQSLASAYDQMSPDSYDIYTKITSAITQLYTQTLLKRIHSIRSPLRLAGSAPKHAGRDQILLAYNGSDASIGQLSGTGGLTPEKATYGVWLDGFGKGGDQDETDGFNGYKYNVYGATLGLDRTFGTRFVAGIGIGYSYTDVGLDGSRGKGDIDTICGALYGSYFTRRMYVDAALSYGRQSYDTERNIVIGPLLNTASSDHSGNTYSAFAEGGYNVDIKNWIIQPFVSLHYIYLDEESFRESGAGGGSLRVESRQTDSLVSELGARITRVFRIKNSSLIPEISAAWNYDFDIDDRMITASFAGAPGTSFSVRGQDVEQHGATVGAGLTFISKGGLSASLKYNGEFRENYQAHGILVGLRYEF